MDKVIVIRNEYYNCDSGPDYGMAVCANEEVAKGRLQLIARDEYACWADNNDVKTKYDELPEGEHYYIIKPNGDLLEVIFGDDMCPDPDMYEWRIDKGEDYFDICESWNDTTINIWMGEMEVLIDANQ